MEAQNRRVEPEGNARQSTVPEDVERQIEIMNLAQKS
jgi:hypothetical protein